MATLDIPQVVSPRLILQAAQGGIAPRVTQQVQALVYELNRRLQEAYVGTNLGSNTPFRSLPTRMCTYARSPMRSHSVSVPKAPLEIGLLTTPSRIAWTGVPSPILMSMPA